MTLKNTYFIFGASFLHFSSNKSLADSLEDCVDPNDPNFNKVDVYKMLFIVNV